MMKQMVHIYNVINKGVELSTFKMDLYKKDNGKMDYYME